MAESVSIPGRFNGPRQSGQGGYSAGAIAELLDGPVEVTLRRPVPLDTDLAVAREGDGSVQVLDGEALIIQARPAPEFQTEVPPGVGLDDARRASGAYRGAADGPFSHCFVCGLARDDALGVFAGAIEGRDLVASPWTPPSWTADPEGRVRPEFVWAVLDCPTYFAAYPGEELPMSVLAQLTARIDAPVHADEEHAVIAWPLEVDGRKRYAGAAVITGEGEPLAVAKALMIELRDA